jgi:S-adenosylmethionine hydrolase
MAIISLLTDFSIKDGNVALIKGVIWKIAPEVQIVDISHMNQPQKISEAALILFHAAPCYTPQTVHVVVVNPGVGNMASFYSEKQTFLWKY